MGPRRPALTLPSLLLAALALATGLAPAPARAAVAPDWVVSANAGPAPAVSDPAAPTPLVFVAGGDFVHPGSNDGLKLRVDPFWLERTPVTWRQYKRVLGNTAHWTACIAEHEAEYPPDAPVVYVTWDDAQAYAQAIGRRLPTETEWEYVAAGGVKREPHKLLPEEAREMTWYGGARKQPKLVGRARPNAYGVYDMHGNVWEWVDDLRGNYARKDARDPNSGTDNLGCGNVSNDDGSYAWFLRAAVRSAARRDQPMRYRGFRCAQ
jgi:formylglycine-generating enzyme required for sulfatase activity